jgi:S1-C subfamily serine protease
MGVGRALEIHATASAPAMKVWSIRRERLTLAPARGAGRVALIALWAALLCGQGLAVAEPACGDEQGCAGEFRIVGLQDAPAAKSPTLSRRSGTAWLSDSGYLVTSLHVVNGQDRILVISAWGAQHSARLVAADTANDIAILAFPGHRSGAQGMRAALEPARLGSAVSFVGYPMPSVLGRQPKVQGGIIFGRDGARDDPRHMQISAHALAGHSGSPVLDAEGTVVGMVVGRLTLSNGQDIPQLALAIKVEHVATLLSRLPDAEGAPRRTAAVDTPAVQRSRNAADVTESVYLVLSDSVKKEPPL